MNRSVQVVDQLRADGALRQNQFNRGERVVCVAAEHRKERLVSFGRLKVLVFHGRRAALCQARDRSPGAPQVFADLST